MLYIKQGSIEILIDSFGQEIVEAIAWRNVVDIKFEENLPIIVITIFKLNI